MRRSGVMPVSSSKRRAIITEEAQELARSCLKDLEEATDTIKNNHTIIRALQRKVADLELENARLNAELMEKDFPPQ